MKLSNRLDSIYPFIIMHYSIIYRILYLSTHFYVTDSEFSTMIMREKLKREDFRVLQGNTSVG